MRARSIVTRALRMLAVLAVDEPPQAYQVEDGLDLLNAMLFGWKAEGLDYEHAEIGPNDEPDVDESLHLGICYLLAMRLADEYSKPIPAMVAMEANRWTSMIWAAIGLAPVAEIEIAAFLPSRPRTIL
jgi:hypothetical protein